jgi:hypothetical protein
VQSGRRCAGGRDRRPCGRWAPGLTAPRRGPGRRRRHGGRGGGQRAAEGRAAHHLPRPRNRAPRARAARVLALAARRARPGAPRVGDAQPGDLPEALPGSGGGGAGPGGGGPPPPPRRTTQPTRGERGGATRSAGFLAGPRRGRELRAARRQRARVRGAPFMPFIISSIIFSRFCPSRPNTAWNTCSASSCRPRGRQRRARKVHHPTAGQHPAARMPHTPPHPCTKWTRRVPHPVLIGHAASRSPLTCDNGCPLPKPPGKPPGKPSKPCPPPPPPPAPNMS